MTRWQGMLFVGAVGVSMAVFACGSGAGSVGNAGAGFGAAVAGDSARGGGSAAGGTASEGGNAGAQGMNRGGSGGTSTSGAGGTNASGASGASVSGTGGTSTSGAGGTSASGAGGTSASGSGGTSASGSGGLGAGAAPNGSSCTHGGLCASGHCAAGSCVVAPSWGAPITLSSAPGAPSVVMPSFGQGVVAWRDDPHDQVLARVAAAKTFGAEARIDTNGGAVSVSDPKLALTGGQSFVATWSESFSSSDYRVFARPFAAGWGSSSDIDGASSAMQLPRIATNAQGNGVVVWNGRDDSFIWARSVNGTSFGVPQNFSFGDDQAVAASPSGRVAVAWCRTVTGTSDLWVATYQPGVGWGASARAYEGTVGGSCNHPAIAIDDAG
ncbi:MAG: hypothetical protein ABW061_09605, partial [Polyangiaceae bacterium]